MRKIIWGFNRVESRGTKIIITVLTANCIRYIIRLDQLYYKTNTVDNSATVERKTY